MKKEQAPDGAKDTTDRDDFITLARVIKTQGRHGEVAAEIHSDIPDRFAEGMKLFALGKEAEVRRELEIESLWPHKGLLVFKFRGVGSISDAERLIGSELQVPRTQRAELAPGWTYVSDLIGWKAFDHGREIGRIEDVQFGAGEAPLLIVASAGEPATKGGEVTKGREVTKYDVPFAEAYLERVDAAQQQVRMNLPEGMLEINAPVTAEEKQEQSRPQKRKKH